ncbi:kinase-like domain-containing protein [Hypoxylon sp. NC1633]|nr:kinase-like domain-containing protein [Hypoxylon sp. NC1633]
MLDRGAPLDIITTLETRIDDCQLANETGQLFVPNGTLEGILEEETVRNALLELPAFQDGLEGGAEEYATRICSQIPHIRKILALLLLTDMFEAIVTFVELGINDLALPMPEPRLLDEHSSPCNENDSDSWIKWKNLANSWRRSHLRNLYARQWCLLAPHLTRQDSILHYKFTHNRILPFLQNDVTILDHSEMSNPSSEVVRYGSFSQVRRVKIHPDHYDFGDYGVNNPDHQFAVKMLWTHNFEDFTQEIEVFKRHWKPHIHIVPLLATYEISGIEVDDPIRSYYLIFPWATGDLRSLWETNEELKRNHKAILWISRECYEITRALSHIHGNLDSPPTSADSFGRHGDIKPSNILWYPNASGTNTTDLGKLVLADFGLADFHRASSRTTSRTASLPRSMTYMAPEFDTTKVISQAIDIWALGCTFLEFVTWFVKGNRAVRDEFRDYRSEPDMYGITADMFFQVRHHHGQQYVLLKPQVETWIERLRSDRSCSKYLKDFMDIIQYDMLIVDRIKRKTAGEISQKLKELHLRCISDSDYSQASTSKPPISTTTG